MPVKLRLPKLMAAALVLTIAASMLIACGSGGGPKAFVGTWAGSLDGEQTQLEFFEDGSVTVNGQQAGTYSVGSAMDSPVLDVLGVRFFYEMAGDQLTLAMDKATLESKSDVIVFTRE